MARLATSSSALLLQNIVPPVLFVALLLAAVGAGAHQADGSTAAAAAASFHPPPPGWRRTPCRATPPPRLFPSGGAVVPRRHPRCQPPAPPPQWCSSTAVPVLRCSPLFIAANSGLFDGKSEHSLGATNEFHRHRGVVERRSRSDSALFASVNNESDDETPIDVVNKSVTTAGATPAAAATTTTTTTLASISSARDNNSSNNGMGNGNGGGGNGDDDDLLCQPPRVYPQRWVQLAYLSLLALLSDWICFSVAASPATFEAVYYPTTAASLIDLFLFTNVLSCFLVTDVVAKVGLQRAVQGAAVVMTVGCWLRSGLSFLPFVGAPDANDLVSYPLVVFGTVLVGAAQPFFQCTPPMLSATWFAPAERATATAVALNFNQIGIATAFVVGGAMASDPYGLCNYFGLIAVACTLVTLGAMLQFQNEPPGPPSASEMNKKRRGIKEPPFFESVRLFFKTRGFTPALAAFVCSIVITNVVGTFIDEIMERGGITEQVQIDLAGAGFELAILLGGVLIGGYVDRTKQYKNVTLACLAMTAVAIIPLGLTEHAIGKEPLLLVLALLILGLVAGPVQPINAELAVDVTFPCDETAVESVQQIGGNMISALLIPVAELASQNDYELLPTVPMLASDVRGDVVLLVLVALGTMAYFNTFDAPLARTTADGEEVCTDDTSIAVVIDEVEGPAKASTQ